MEVVSALIVPTTVRGLPTNVPEAADRSPLVFLVAAVLAARLAVQGEESERRVSQLKGGKDVVMRTACNLSLL